MNLDQEEFQQKIVFITQRIRNYAQLYGGRILETNSQV